MSSSSLLPQIGDIILALALGFSAFGIAGGILAEKLQRQALSVAAQRALYATCILLSSAVLIMLISILQGNFLIKYVYSYSNLAMPFVYKIASLWGGQEGSLLFWVWLASVFSALACLRHRNTDRPLMPYFVAILSAILAFFLVLLVFHESPFKLFQIAPADGKGLNPLLQNPSMALHPPSLYFGYVGMSVPFAFALSALISNRLDTRWIVASRLWLLISWFFLSIGNLLGAQWAYVELGWGGFWGWDPVENAAIMPWFTASAFLHSVMIQEKRGMLKFWNVNLIVISFCLTILGTYLTRSGVVQSVHSFARSDIGYYFLTFLLLVILFSGFWIFRRRKELKSDRVFESLISKESAFVVNNIILVGTAFIILWCTLFPTASEIIIGTRIIVGPPFFNKMLAPLAAALLLLTGIGPLIAWRKATPENIRYHFVWPAVLGGIGCLVAALLKVREWYVLATIFGAIFVLMTIFDEFIRGTRARMIQTKEPWSVALFRSTFRNNRKYGGYIVHLGIVLIFIGIAGAAYKEVYEFRLRPNQTATYKEYGFRFRGFDFRKATNQEETYALIDVWVNNKFQTTLKPARFYYYQPDQPSTEVDILPRLKEDVYLTLGQVNPETEEALFHLTLNPLISFLWLGGFILIIGGVIAMLPPLKTQRSESAKT